VTDDKNGRALKPRPMNRTIHHAATSYSSLRQSDPEPPETATVLLEDGAIIWSEQYRPSAYFPQNLALGIRALLRRRGRSQ
jgi:hypothetical protein